MGGSWFDRPELEISLTLPGKSLFENAMSCTAAMCMCWLIMTLCRFSMLRIGLSPTNLIRCTPDFFKQTAALARKHPGVRLHSHLAEIKEEVETIHENFGCSPSEHLKWAFLWALACQELLRVTMEPRMLLHWHPYNSTRENRCLYIRLHSK